MIYFLDAKELDDYTNIYLNGKPCRNPTPFQLSMPADYIAGKPHYDDKGFCRQVEIDIIESYRNYYKLKIGKQSVWTRRTIPSWVISKG